MLWWHAPCGTADPLMTDMSTTVHLGNGTALRTTLSPEEWAAQMMSGAGSAWVGLEDGRTVLVRLRNVVSVEPPAGWERRASSAGDTETEGEGLSPDSAI